ncbi:MAG: hypothetical protein M4579_005762 [Chaenotheca gracillima]|nr:MAG: hypothetical protein M4579_005762 [Chaenotheca gracillima]
MATTATEAIRTTNWVLQVGRAQSQLGDHAGTLIAFKVRHFTTRRSKQHARAALDVVTKRSELHRQAYTARYRGRDGRGAADSDHAGTQLTKRKFISIIDMSDQLASEQDSMNPLKSSTAEQPPLATDKQLHTIAAERPTSADDTTMKASEHDKHAFDARLEDLLAKDAKDIPSEEDLLKALVSMMPEGSKSPIKEARSSNASFASSSTLSPAPSSS